MRPVTGLAKQAPRPSLISGHDRRYNKKGGDAAKKNET
jgi:hypothetical protein